MKLRNKKTGAIIERNSIVTLECKITSCGSSLVEAEEFSSIEQLNEEWEDYEPTKPLIEDEKSRKVFREWAGFFGAERFRVNHLCKYGRTIITSTDLISEPVIELPGYIGEDSKIYARVELCGEENSRPVIVNDVK